MKKISTNFVPSSVWNKFCFRFQMAKVFEMSFFQYLCFFAWGPPGRISYFFQILLDCIYNVNFFAHKCLALIDAYSRCQVKTIYQFWLCYTSFLRDQNKFQIIYSQIFSFNQSNNGTINAHFHLGVAFSIQTF